MVETRHQSEAHRFAESLRHRTLEDILNDENWELLGQLKNQRGDIAVLFQNKQTGEKLNFPNVNPEHIPQKFHTELKTLRETHTHYTYDTVRDNKDFKEILSHKNAKDNYAKVYLNERTGERITFANVSE
jgi:hypothetical protein